jgi:hypothetical protein
MVDGGSVGLMLGATDEVEVGVEVGVATGEEVVGGVVDSVGVFVGDGVGCTVGVSVGVDVGVDSDGSVVRGRIGFAEGVRDGELDVGVPDGVDTGEFVGSCVVGANVTGGVVVETLPHVYSR